MIIRKLNKPLILSKLDALIPRLNPQHPSFPPLQREAAQRQAGYNGELKLTHYLRFLPETFTVLFDVTLEINKMHIQFDCLILSGKAIYIIEVKNYNGIIVFDTDLKQCFRDNGETLEGFDDPITQVQNAAFSLENWLDAAGLNGFPIHSFIAFSHAETIIKIQGDDTKNNITHITSIPHALVKKDDAYPHKNNSLKGKIIRKLLQNCIDFDIDIMKKHNIHLNDIQPGVSCPNCFTFTMTWRQHCWRCNKCQHKSSYAHLQALQEYKLLIDKKMTNRQCRSFLKIDSRHTARRLLQNAGYQLNGNTRHWIS